MNKYSVEIRHTQKYRFRTIITRANLNYNVDSAMT